MNNIYRILDANFNRASEGLRVIEEYFRFIKEYPRLVKKIKDLRHQISLYHNIKYISRGRDTSGDIGKRITTFQEKSRLDSLSILRASFKRTEEALRTIEEYIKIESSKLGEKIKKLRYELYICEQQALNIVNLVSKLDNVKLYVLVTESLCYNRDIIKTVKEIVKSGVKLIQLREKEMEDKRLLKIAKELRKITLDYEVLFIINDRPDIAILSEADGVHLGQKDLPPSEVRKWCGENIIIGLSTHSIQQAKSSQIKYINYIGAGPVFSTTTKKITRIAGIEYLKRLKKENYPLPFFAIGGITLENISQLKEIKISRIAVCSSIIGSSNIKKTIKKFFRYLES